MISRKVTKMTPFMVMEVLERAKSLEREGHRVIHLEVGEPDFPTPAPVKEALIQALKEEKTGYTPSLGIMEMREAVARHHLDRYGVEIDPEEVVITSGTSPAMLMVFGALLDDGDEVILADPGYPCYDNFIEFVGAKPVRVPVYEEDGFQFRVKEIKKRVTKRTKAIVINSPANPTGNLLSKERMAQIADLGLWVVSDEIYHGLVYEGKEHTIREFTPESFVLNGFSKLFAMTGWRLGYAIAPLGFIRGLQKLQQNFFISANSFVQWAGLVALKSPEVAQEVENMRATYDRRRRYMIGRLKGMGLGITVEPTGAFYVLANAKHLTHDSYSFAFKILEEALVGVTPGIDFGPGGEGYLRFSYANSIENIEEGLDRLEGFLARL